MSMYVNPLAQTADEAEEIVGQLYQAADQLQRAIFHERNMRIRAQDAKEALSAAESEVVNDAVLQAQEKRGPLANIATTSKAYQVAIDVLLHKERSSTLQPLFGDAVQYALDAERASVELQQAQVQYSALKHIADLKAAVLHARMGRA